MLIDVRVLLGVFLFFSCFAAAKLNVAATTSDVEAIVKAVGGDKVEVFAVAKGTQDAHQIEAKPSFMVKFRNADLVVSQGLELESAWLIPLIQGSRNTRIAQGTTGFLELGPSLDPIEVPGGNVSRALGDVHPGGNPHFQLDPIRLGKAGVLIAGRLGELEPASKDFFFKNAENFQKKMLENEKKWKTRLEKTGVKEVVTYHKTLSYFLDRFGIKAPMQLEPKPGIPPTARHILEVIDHMNKNHVSIVLIENYFDDAVRGKIEKEVKGSKVRRVPVSVGGDSDVTTNEALIESLVRTIEAAAK